MEKQTWKNFHLAARGKKVFIFGVGAAVKYLIGKCGSEVVFAGAIDNDVKKQGFRVGDFSAESLGTIYEKLRIYSVDILKNCTDDMIILITNMRNYEDIMKQLDAYRVRCFSLVLMEFDRKNADNVNDLFQLDFIEKREKYIEQCCRDFDIVPHKILVYIGKYGGHGKNITKSLLQSGRTLDIVWVVNDLRTEAPQGVRLIYVDNWKKYIYEMETSHIWIYDITVPAYIRKRLGQIYIQTKHWSSVTLKKFYLDDASTISSNREIEMVKHNGSIMDYIFCGSEFDKASCKSGFAFQGEFVQTGSARTDTLFRAGVREKVYRQYGIDDHIHSVLYAPTFRIRKIENEMKKGEVLNFTRLKQALEIYFGGNWYILLRLHPSMAADSGVPANMDFVIDASDYCDSQELVASCDILISDYSSIMFEPAFVEKPVFLFAPDRDEYVEKERDLLIEYDTLPFAIAQTNEELAEYIKNFDYEEYKRTLRLFMGKYGVYEDGHASERAAEFIMKLIY